MGLSGLFGLLSTSAASSRRSAFSFSLSALDKFSGFSVLLDASGEAPGLAGAAASPSASSFSFFLPPKMLRIERFITSEKEQQRERPPISGTPRNNNAPPVHLRGAHFSLVLSFRLATLGDSPEVEPEPEADGAAFSSVPPSAAAAMELAAAETPSP